MYIEFTTGGFADMDITDVDNMDAAKERAQEFAKGFWTFEAGYPIWHNSSVIARIHLKEV